MKFWLHVETGLVKIGSQLEEAFGFKENSYILDHLILNSLEAIRPGVTNTQSTKTTSRE